MITSKVARGAYWLPKSEAELKISALVLSTLDEYEISGWSVIFSRERNRMGYCNYTTKEIVISRRVILTCWKQAVDTALHEVAHAIVGPQHGHDSTWKAAARKLGATPEAAASGYTNQDEIGKKQTVETNYGVISLVVGEKVDVLFKNLGTLRVLEITRGFSVLETEAGVHYKLPVDVLHPNYGDTSKILVRKVMVEDEYGIPFEVTLGESSYRYAGKTYVALEAKRRNVIAISETGDRLKIHANQLRRLSISI